MKFILLLLCSLLALFTYAQSTEADSSQIRILRNKSDKSKENSISELFIIGKNSYRKGNGNTMGHYPPFKGHWSGFHYGFVNFVHLPEDWKSLELDWSHSFSMQFNLCKYSINLVPRNNFGLVTGLGLEYQRLRFSNDYISIAKTAGAIEIIHPRQIYDNVATSKRSCFKILYLTIPLVMELQFPAAKAKKMYISGGFMGGLRLHSKTKFVYEDKDGDKIKKKNKGDFKLIPFKADAIARIGYRNVNVWGSYTLTNLFRTENEPGLHTYTVGLGLTF